MKTKEISFSIVFSVIGLAVLLYFALQQMGDNGSTKLYLVGYGIGLLMTLVPVLNRYLKNGRTVGAPELVAVFLLTFVVGFLIQLKVPNDETLNLDWQGTFKNPVYDKMAKIADEYGLSSDYMKEVWDERTPYDTIASHLYTNEPKSLDILILGDSSIAWGLIPSVLEEMTGKKVGVFSFESNLMNEMTCKLYNILAEYYLKEDGLLVLAFDLWTQEVDPNVLVLSPEHTRQLISWSQEEFDVFASNYRNSKKEKVESFEDRWSFNSYSDKYDKVSTVLCNDYSVGLNSYNFYQSKIEPIANPEWSTIKQVDESEELHFLRWSYRSILCYLKDPPTQSIHSDAEASLVEPSEALIINAKAARAIPASRKAYCITITNNHYKYQRLRGIYQKLFSDEFELIDLGRLHPKDAHYPMQSEVHMANEGGLMKSILFGQWLKDNP